MFKVKSSKSRIILVPYLFLHFRASPVPSRDHNCFSLYSFLLINIFELLCICRAPSISEFLRLVLLAICVKMFLIFDELELNVKNYSAADLPPQETSLSKDKLTKYEFLAPNISFI